MTSGDPKKLPAKVIAVIDVEAEAALTGLSLAAFELYDSAGGRLAYGILPAELRLAPGYEPPAVPYGAETSAFDGRVAAGTTVRLWVEATLDVRLQSLLDVTPERFQVTFSLADGRQVQVGGRVGETWSG
jgi:hypothetical protein